MEIRYKRIHCQWKLAKRKGRNGCTTKYLSFSIVITQRQIDTSIRIPYFRLHSFVSNEQTDMKRTLEEKITSSICNTFIVRKKCMNFAEDSVKCIRFFKSRVVVVVPVSYIQNNYTPNESNVIVLLRMKKISPRLVLPFRE